MAGDPVPAEQRKHELNIRTLSQIFSWIAPGGVVLLAAWTWVAIAPESEALATLARGYPYVIFGGAILLSWRFHRSRIAAAILAVGVIERGLQTAAESHVEIAVETGAFFLPLTLAVMAVLSDRGLFTKQGLLQLGGVVVLLPIAIQLARGQPDFWVQFFALTLFEGGLPIFGEVSQPSGLAFTAGFGVAVTFGILRKKAVEKGLMWALLTSYLGFSSPAGTPVSTAYFLAAGLILAISVVETSYAMAYQDELTGLPSRRAMPATMSSLGNRYAIAMVDIDHFKGFNDKHGHDVGDQVLRMVASKLAKVQAGGRAFRYGGEEFTIIFPGKSLQEVWPHLEALRKTIHGSTFVVRAPGRRRRKPGKISEKMKSRPRKTLTVAVSIGVAERRARFPTPDEVIKAADQALYRAKEAGRNRVMR
jgi:diguanylate cyclase (GGDEF)-like protein